MIVLFSLILIACSVKELIRRYRYQQKMEIINLLLVGEKPKAKVESKKKQRDVAFENIVSKNSATVNILTQFRDQQLWKIYATIILFCIFVIANQFFIHYELNQQLILITLFAIIIAVILLPDKIVQAQAMKRIKGVSRDLPIVIDIMAIMIKSGMTVENCINYLSTRIKPINPDIEIILQRGNLMLEVNGVSSAIELIYREVPSKEIRMLCATLNRSISFGNSIYEALLDLSTEIREMQKLDIEEKIAAISAKMTVPMMVLILFPVLVIIAGPIAMRMMDSV